MLAGYATHTDAARGLPRRPEWNLAMTPQHSSGNKKDTARCCRHLDDDDLCCRPRRAPAPAPSLAIMGRALALVCAAVTCAVAAGAGANEPIAPNELGLTAIDCATQYCTSKDSLLLWLALENTCFSDKQPRAAASSNFAGPRGCSRRRAGGGGSAAAAARTSPGPGASGARVAPPAGDPFTPHLVARAPPIGFPTPSPLRYSTSTSLAAVDVAASVSQLWSFNVVGAITMSIMAVGLVVGYAAGARSAEQHRR